MYPRRAALPLFLLFALLLGCSSQGGALHGDPPSSEAAQDQAASEDGPISAVPLTAKLGDRVEVRPGLFVTTMARTVNLPAGETGARADSVEVTILYDNQTQQPMQGMGTLEALGTVADLNGQTFSIAFEGASEQVGNVFPGRTGKVLQTLQPVPGWTRADEVQIGVRQPTLLGEPEVGFSAPQTLFVGVPTPA